VAKVNSKLKILSFSNFVINIISIKKCDNAMNDDLNPKVKELRKPIYTIFMFICKLSLMLDNNFLHITHG
jgi:hypothetical protein